MTPLDLPLTELERADLIRMLRDPERAYLFKHNLVQETVHASLLKNDRRALHRVCAEVLEQTYPEQLDEHAARLAQHFMEAGDEPKTFRYACRAGDLARQQHAYAEALMHYDTALVLAPRLPLASADIVAVYQSRGRTAELMGNYPEALATYEALLALGNLRSDRELELGAMLALLTPYTIPSPVQNLELAAEWNARALTLARELGNGEAETRILWNSVLRSYFDGHLERAAEYGSAALGLADQLQLTELRAFILNDMSRALITTDSVGAGMKSLDRARVLWRELGNLPMLADNLASSAENAEVGGQWDLADQYIREAEELSTTIGNRWNLAYVNGTRAQLALLRGEVGEFFQASERAIENGIPSGFFLAALLARMLRGQLIAELGAPERSIELLDELKADVEVSPFFILSWWLGIKQRAFFLKGDYASARVLLEQMSTLSGADDLASIGPVLNALGTADMALYAQDYARALDICDGFLERLDHLEIVMLRPDLILRRGLALLGLQDWDAAARVLDQAERLARDLRARAVLWRILVAQSDLAAQRGDAARGRALRDEARTVIQQIIDTIPTDPAQTCGVDLRAAIYTEPSFRAVLGT